MALDEILEDLLFKSLEQPKSPGGMDIDSQGTGAKGATPDILILTLERECRKQYRDPGPGLHFVGLLLAVFAAELVSAYWTQNTPSNKTAGLDRGPARMVSVIYSTESVAFVLSHPNEVPITFQNFLTRRHKDNQVKRSNKIGHKMELRKKRTRQNSYMLCPPPSIYPTILHLNVNFLYHSSVVHEDIRTHRREIRANLSTCGKDSRSRIYCHL
jgi:hypothetical protein